MRGLTFAADDGWLSAILGGGLVRFDPAGDPADDPDHVPCDAMLLSPDGRRAVAIRWAGVNRFEQTMFAARRPHGRWIPPALPLPPTADGRYLAAILPDGRRLFGSDGGVEVSPGDGSASQYPPGVGSRRVVVAVDGRAAFLHDAVGVWKNGEWATGTAPVAAADAAFHPDGRHLMVAGKDGTVRLLDAETLDERTAWRFEVGRPRACAVAPDGLTAAVATAARLVLFDLD